MPGGAPSSQPASRPGTDRAHRGSPRKCQIVRQLRHSHRAIRDAWAGTFSRVLRPIQPRTPPRKRQRHSARCPEMLQLVCGQFLPGGLPSAISYFFETSGRILEGSAELSTLYHLPAIRVQRIVNNPFGGIDFVVVAKAQVAKTLGNRIQTSGLRLMPQRVVRVSAVNDFGEQLQSQVCLEAVLLENRFEGAFLAVVSKLDTRNVEWCCVQSLRLRNDLFRRHKMELCVRVHEPPDKPRAGDSLDFDV